MRKQVKDGAILMRLRKHFAAEGGHFRRPGADQVARGLHGAWYVLNDAGIVTRSAKTDRAPDETLRQLAARLGLLAGWER
jgi:hypothetical protein